MLMQNKLQEESHSFTTMETTTSNLFWLLNSMNTEVEEALIRQMQIKLIEPILMELLRWLVYNYGMLFTLGHGVTDKPHAKRYQNSLNQINVLQNIKTTASLCLMRHVTLQRFVFRINYNRFIMKGNYFLNKLYLPLSVVEIYLQSKLIRLLSLSSKY